MRDKGILAALVVLACTAFAERPPPWFSVLPDDSALLYGRGSAVVDGAGIDALARARRDAKRELAHSLICRLHTETIDHQEEGAASRFVSRTTVESELDLVNVRVLEEYVGRRAAFALVAVERADMAAAYRDRVRRLQAAAAAAFELGTTLEADQPREAIAAYEESLAAANDAVAAMEVYLTLNRWQQDIDVAGPGTDAIRRNLLRLSAATPRSIAQIAKVLADGLIPVDGHSPIRVFVLPIEFEHTGLVSDFGRALGESLAVTMAARPGVGLATDAAAADLHVRGRMIREGDGVLLVLHAGEKAIQHFVEPVTCAAIGPDRLAPPDLERLLLDSIAAQKSMAAPTGLSIELRTDKSLHGGPVVYRFGDQPRLTVRANQSCVVRLVFVTAEGQRLLLLDRHPIGAHQANQWVALPLELEVCPPAGVERLILQAATDEQDARLPPLRVRNKDMGDGWVLPVIEEELGDALARTRGIMMRRPRHYAETVSHWTVFEK